jgi:predicted ferric reductase
MVTATIGTAVMIAVVVSSLVIARRRMPYEAWYAIHLSIYVGIVLAYFHQLPTGNEFTANPAQRDYWIALYVATLALLLAYRVAAPLLRALRYRLRVADVRVEGPGVVSLTVTGRGLDRLGARAGQFFRWRFLDRARWWQSHPFSLSAAPDGHSLRISIKDSGDFTHRIGELRPGTRVLADGPFGTFTEVRRTHPRVALIAGGIGITPLRALFEALPAGRGDLALIYRVLRDEDLVLRDELERIAAERGADLFLVVGDHRHPEHHDRLAPGRLRAMVPDLPSRDVYLCGPAQMMNEVKRSLREAGVPRRQIHTERFALAL